MKKVKVIIAGSRTFNDYKKLNDFMNAMTKYIDIESIICGEARGADILGSCWARANDIPVRSMPADWATHGKKAGYIRNSEMADIGDVLILFWDGISKGSKHMYDLAKRKGLSAYIVRFKI
jgi:hypothetical protein